MTAAAPAAGQPAGQPAYEQCGLDIYLVSETTDVTFENLELMATAYLLQLVRDVAKRYPTLGLERTSIKAVQKLSDIPVAPVVDLTDPTKRGQLILAYLQDADVAGAAGYHSLTPDGRPYGRVFTRYQGVFIGLRGSSGVHVTGSHETIEAACDPGVNRTRIGPDGKARDFEPGDPVEAQFYSENLPGGTVDLSDFVFETWFDGSGPPPYNQTGNVTTPCQLGPLVDGQQENYIQGEDAQGNPFTDPPGMAAKLASSPNKSHPAARTERRRVERVKRHMRAKFGAAGAAGGDAGAEAPPPSSSPTIETDDVETKGPNTQPAGVAPPGVTPAGTPAGTSAVVGGPIPGSLDDSMGGSEAPSPPPVEEWRALGQKAVDALVKQGHDAAEAKTWVENRVDEVMSQASVRKAHGEIPRHTHAFVTGQMAKIVYDAGQTKTP